VNDEGQSVVVTILDKDYRFSCKPEDRDALVASAHYLDGKMREIRRGGKLLGNDGLAMMAALNIAHELLAIRSGKEDRDDALSGRIRTLQDKIEVALSRGQQMEL